MILSKRTRMTWILILSITLILSLLTGLDASPGKGKKPPGGGGGGLPENPDIVFVDYGKTNELTLLDSATGNEGVLRAGGSHPGWSVDGSRIAYYLSNTSPDGDIWISNADGTGDPSHLVQANLSFGRLDWTRNPAPNGREMIIFSVIDPDLNWLVYATNSDGTGLVELVGPWFGPGTDPDWVCVDDPKWSPDGTGFVAMDDNYGDDGRLVIFDVDMVGGVLAVTGYEQITNLPTCPVTGWAWALDWSNSGDWISFLCNSDIYIINTYDYMDVRRLTYSPDKDKWGPCFDATDSRIIFVMLDKNKRKLVSIDALDGSGLIQLTDTTGLTEPAAKR